ncbi:Npun_R2821/Npun_R2822 family protein [Mastigocoleus testarum]|uniref:Methionine synthase n=1 Tax=Mastigocoleus testarum BC008 TaxID=371196 RepID=A0A0V7ZZP7_9CYAN|nr:Npun_R2821/Npun_R2822 family protein [Mastigocoleus testarum]KST70028.1 methionine synthase [Mastigocoleus testarum BC008]
MTRGVYIVANDYVIDNAIALVNSIRSFDKEIPIILIPFNEQFHNIASTLSHHGGVEVFPDLKLIDEFTQKVQDIFPRNFLALPNKMRKLVAWLGPLDEFIYIDTDIIVFESPNKTLNKLTEYDFICCDYHHVSEGLKNVFSDTVKEKQIFSDSELEDVFNSGYWASKKEVISPEKMEATLRECSVHEEYFDFTKGVTDQPILNYLVLKNISKRHNMVKVSGGAPGSWAGSRHFEEKDRILYDKGKRLEYLHWAGMKIKPGCPYWNVWEHYRYLNESKKEKLKRLMRRIVPFVGV